MAVDLISQLTLDWNSFLDKIRVSTSASYQASPPLEKISWLVF